MPSKILAIGDLHIQPDTLAEVNTFLKQLEKWLSTNPVDLIVVLGDTLHTHETVYTECLNKMLEYLKLCEKYAETEVLIGNHDYCFAENTPVLMYDKSIKYSQDIMLGDTLMGDDNSARNVISLIKGSNGKMYDIIQNEGIKYTVTENHILCLCTISEFGVLDKTVELSVKDYLNLSKNDQEVLYGYKSLDSKNLPTRIKISKSNQTIYTGWKTNGNHKFLLKDYTVVHNCNNSQFLTNAHPFAGWKKAHNIVDTVKIRHMKDKKIVLVPYVPDGRFIEALNTVVKEEWKSADCIFAHQLFDGAKMGPVIAKGVEKWDQNFPMLISGHIHDKQLPQKNLWYTGSSMQISFGEREDHTLSLITIPDKGDILIEEVNIHPPMKKILYCDVSKIKEMKIPEEENVKLKVTLSGDSEEFKTFKKTDQYKKLLNKGVKVVFKQKRNTPLNLPTTKLKSFPDILFSLIEDVPEMLDMYNSLFGMKEREIIFE